MATPGSTLYGHFNTDDERLDAKYVVDENTVYVRGLPANLPANHSFTPGMGRTVRTSQGEAKVAAWV